MIFAIYDCHIHIVESTEFVMDQVYSRGVVPCTAVTFHFWWLHTVKGTEFVMDQAYSREVNPCPTRPFHTFQEDFHNFGMGSAIWKIPGVT